CHTAITTASPAVVRIPRLEMTLMMSRGVCRILCGAALVAAPVAVLAQYTVPHTIAVAGDVATTLRPTVFVNHGLVGVGRIPASKLDSFGETFGSVSSMQITNWVKNANGSFTGTLNILPDRGYNIGSFFSDFAARIQTVDFAFTPYIGLAPLD